MDFLADRPLKEVGVAGVDVDEDGDPVLNRKHPEVFSLDIGELHFTINVLMKVFLLTSNKS